MPDNYDIWSPTLNFVAPIMSSHLTAPNNSRLKWLKRAPASCLRAIGPAFMGFLVVQLIRMEVRIFSFLPLTDQIFWTQTIDTVWSWWSLLKIGIKPSNISQKPYKSFDVLMPGGIRSCSWIFNPKIEIVRQQKTTSFAVRLFYVHIF